MQVQVLLFAAARQRAAADSIAVEVPKIATAAELLEAIGKQYPSLVELLPACRLAVDSDYVDGEHQLSATSEIALIPPVSGG